MERTNPKTVEVVKTGFIVGRDNKVVMPDEVELMASLGCPDREIAEYFGINDDTLRYNFKSFLINGKQNLRNGLRKAQIRIALEGNATMLIWLGKQILSQSDTVYNTDAEQPLPWIETEITETDATETINKLEPDNANT
jgi:hypothetical protein